MTHQSRFILAAQLVSCRCAGVPLGVAAADRQLAVCVAHKSKEQPSSRRTHEEDEEEEEEKGLLVEEEEELVC